MTAAPQIKGWCPGALRPMLSGDGWLVRIRPSVGVLTPAQAIGLAQASLAHGNGMIDLSSRASLQLRGIRHGAHAPLINDLRGLGLVDADMASEAARNIVVTPFWSVGDGTDGLVHDLARALAAGPQLPGKFGFAIDTGPHPVLAATPADIRLERSAAGDLILRPDGAALGCLVTAQTAVAEAIAMARWFIAQGGVADGRGRMAALIARGVVPDGMTTVPAPALTQSHTGLRAEGAMVALAMGQMRAETLMALAGLGMPLRMTPWRMILIAGAQELPFMPGLITDPDDPLLRITACTGAPGCSQAQGITRDLAARRSN